MIDFLEINRSALVHAEGLVSRWLPDGCRKGTEWIARNPKRHDKRAGSFKVNLDTGIWKDFASGDSGSDLISLKAFLYDSSQGDAARYIAGTLKVQISPRNHFPIKRTPRISERSIQAKGEVTIEIPQNLPEPEFNHPCLGHPSQVWPYQNSEGQSIGYACRWETKPRKTYRPFWWNGTGWQWKQVTSNLPLYRLSQILAHEDPILVLCEGEKSADAAQQLLPESVATTWCGGSNAWHKTDFSPIAGKRIIIWPDADEPGNKAATNIHQFLRDSQKGWTVRKSSKIDLPSGLPKGWDAADALFEGWTTKDVLDLFSGFPNTPGDMCPLCWRKGISAIKDGPTCRHGNWQWPTNWPEDHPDFLEPPGTLHYDEWEMARKIL